VQDGRVPADFPARPALPARTRPAPALAPALALAGAFLPARTVGANRAESPKLWRRHKNYGTGFVPTHRYRQCANCGIME
jgi:hypothetical protein